ncbi:unnamed protein product [Thelazia callipaeda]|uniref:Gag-pol polyprotein n=1 Tax=Thelazia callipaeda TaxID=103827 RepID=A0A0N5CPY3_THECL|nr:unnamed protein product [Thelazia callipaeda]
MLRRAPTEIVVKMEEIDEMIAEMNNRAGNATQEINTNADTMVRTRIGAPPPRIHMTQAKDTQGELPNSSDSTSVTTL